MEKFVFVIHNGGENDTEEMFYDPIKAIRLAITGTTVVVLDAETLEYYGYI